MFYSPASEELTGKGEVGVKDTKYSLAHRMRLITLDHMYYIPMAVVISLCGTCEQLVPTASHITAVPRIAPKIEFQCLASPSPLSRP
jgi:hypothetical protein